MSASFKGHAGMGQSQFQLLVAAGNPISGDVTANVQVHAGDGKLTFETNGIGPVGDLIDAAVWEINWKVKNVKTQAQVEYGDSKNMLYITGANVNNQFETVLHIACTGAAGKRPANPGEQEPDAIQANQQVIDGVWGKFSTGEGPANTKNVKDEPLLYWGQGVNMPSWMTVADLLVHRDGKCNAWQQLLIATTEVHGVALFPVGIIPKNWPVPPPPQGWDFLERGIRLFPLPAQGSGGNPAGTRDFRDHAVAYYMKADGSHVILDPSLGRLFQGQTKPQAEGAWEQAILEARAGLFRNQATGALQSVPLAPPLLAQGLNIEFIYPE
jgi:hypothetical protein